MVGESCNTERRQMQVDMTNHPSLLSECKLFKVYIIPMHGERFYIEPLGLH